MKRTNNFKTYISKILLGIYFFALFFSSFHSHNSAEVFVGFHFKKSDKTISENKTLEQAGDCLACHILATGNSLLPEEFSFIVENYTQEIAQIFTQQEFIWSQTKFSFQLRGPPSFS